MDLICLFRWLSVYLSIIYLSIYLSIHPSIHPSTHPSIYLWHTVDIQHVCYLISVVFKHVSSAYIQLQIGTTSFGPGTGGFKYSFHSRRWQGASAWRRHIIHGYPTPMAHLFKNLPAFGVAREVGEKLGDFPSDPLFCPGGHVVAWSGT